MMTPIKLTLYRWAGQWGPFKVNIPCGECTLTLDIIKDVMDNELSQVPIELEVKDWLPNWWKVLPKGGLHAPIVLLGNKVISQGEALNRAALIQHIIGVWAQQQSPQGNVIYSKDNCRYCKQAKQLLDDTGIEYTNHNVVKDSAALYFMIPNVKAHIGLKSPVTMPQIWLNGQYIGGYQELQTYIIDNQITADNVLDFNQKSAVSG